jgi:hypothetical protein
MHRRQMETRSQTYPFIIALLGRICALIVVLAFLGLAAFGIAYDAEWISLIFGGGALAIIVGAFIRYGTNVGNSDENSKED